MRKRRGKERGMEGRGVVPEELWDRKSQCAGVCQ